jgi:hypothetical protein
MGSPGPVTEEAYFHLRASYAYETLPKCELFFFKIIYSVEIFIFSGKKVRAKFPLEKYYSKNCGHIWTLILVW